MIKVKKRLPQRTQSNAFNAFVADGFKPAYFPYSRQAAKETQKPSEPMIPPD